MLSIIRFSIISSFCVSVFTSALAQENYDPRFHNKHKKNVTIERIKDIDERPQLEEAQKMEEPILRDKPRMIEKRNPKLD